MTPRNELLAWVRAARGAVRWHLESGDSRLAVADLSTIPDLRRDPAQTPAAALGTGRAAPSRERERGPAERPVPVPAAVPKRSVEERASALAAVRADVGECTRCPLAQGRNAIIHAVGPANARVAILHEAPSAHDEAAGEPFRGPAGELLDKMLSAMGLSRDAVYLCTLVMCRPPDEREPQAAELAACGTFLKRRLEIVAPEIIVAFGELPLRALVPTAGSIVRARGRWFTWQGAQVMATWGPASMLADPEKKRPAWEDLKKVMARLGPADGARG